MHVEVTSEVGSEVWVKLKVYQVVIGKEGVFYRLDAPNGTTTVTVKQEDCYGTRPIEHIESGA